MVIELNAIAVFLVHFLQAHRLFCVVAVVHEQEVLSGVVGGDVFEPPLAGDKSDAGK